MNDPLQVLTAGDLTVDQRGWHPTTLAEAQQCWPYATKIEVWDGEIMFMACGPWDWHSLVLAERAYPGWTVTLYRATRLGARPPAT